MPSDSVATTPLCGAKWPTPCEDCIGSCGIEEFNEAQEAAATNDDVLRDEQGYPAFEGLEAIMQERKERLIALQQFHAQILAAHLKHLQTGDYTALGIAAQDALLELERREI